MFATVSRLAGVLALALVLASCAPSNEPIPPAPTVRDARENCLTAYRELPQTVATLEEQSGEPADTSTPCDNWVESQGEDGFVEFWTTPSKYLPYAISLAKVDALKEVGLGD